MKKLLLAIPLPLSGVMLGFAALGNLLQSYGEWLRTVCGAVSFVLFILLVLKFLVLPASLKEDMKNPVTASVSATFPMGMILLTVYEKPFLGAVSFWLWWLAIALHAALIVYFYGYVSIEAATAEDICKLLHRICRHCGGQRDSARIRHATVWGNAVLFRLYLIGAFVGAGFLPLYQV